MSELAVPEPHPETALAARGDEPGAPAAAQQPMTDLMLWAESARRASQIAQSLARTSFAGQFRGKPEEITAVILSGQELGLQPMTSLKSIDVIQGQPALRAHAMRALVLGKGHELELVESTDTECVMRGRRKGAERWQEVRWDIPRARLLGLLGKDQWKKQPRTMLVARATGELCRLIAADVLHGMPYVTEELEGTVHAEVVQAPTKAPLSVAALTTPAQQATAPRTAAAEPPPVPDEAAPGGALFVDPDVIVEDPDEPVWPSAAEPGSGARP